MAEFIVGQPDMAAAHGGGGSMRLVGPYIRTDLCEVM